jgi:plastocyanin
MRTRLTGTPVTFLRTAAICTAAGLALAACGGSTPSSDSGSSGSSADLVVTAIDGLAWKDKALTASAGTVTVQLKNSSSLAHNLYIVADDGAELPDFVSSTGKGDDPTETVTLDVGTYTVVCKIAGHSNMRATLTVD